MVFFGNLANFDLMDILDPRRRNRKILERQRKRRQEIAAGFNIEDTMFGSLSKEQKRNKERFDAGSS